MSPQNYLQDFVQYVENTGLRASDSVKKLILAIETLGEETNRELDTQYVLLILLRDLGPLRNFLIRKGLDPDLAIESVHKDLKREQTLDLDPYAVEHDDLYSSKDYRSGFRAQLIDHSIAAATRHSRDELQPFDIFEGCMDAHDENFPVKKNNLWADELLQTPFNTLAHLRGWHSPYLWIKFEDVRSELGLQSNGVIRTSRVELAPARLQPAVRSLLADFPDYRKNCFLIMPFRETPLHKEVHQVLKLTLNELGFNLLRADDHVYAEDLLGNIEAYMYGCRFAIAIHERILSDTANPNVALEVGYMLGLRKEVCLVKERTVVALPSDLSGRLYVEFDSQNLSFSLKTNVTCWLRLKHLIY